jgi:hypothetical protein
MFSGEIGKVFRRSIKFLLLGALMALAAHPSVTAQTKDAKPPQETKKETAPAADEKKDEKKKPLKFDKDNLSAEQVAEAVIYVYGSRPGLEQIRRSGIERGKMTRVGDDGRTEDVTYERRFMRGENVEKDRVRLDQKSSNTDYALIYNDKRVFGVINGTVFTPRLQAANDFLAQSQRSLDTLLRYKENNSTLNLIGKDKFKGFEIYVLDVTDKEKRTTRFYISAQKFRVLALEYEEPVAPGGQPVKFRREFHDYRVAQGTLVPYRTVLYVNGKQQSETNILTVTYGVKIEENLFQTPESSASATTNP